MSAATLNSLFILFTMMSRWSSPMPSITVWLVLSSRENGKEVSSCASLYKAAPILLLSAFSLGLNGNLQQPYVITKLNSDIMLMFLNTNVAAWYTEGHIGKGCNSHSDGVKVTLMTTIKCIGSWSTYPDDRVCELHTLQQDGVLLITQRLCSDHILQASQSDNVSSASNLHTPHACCITCEVQGREWKVWES